jgi:hypothetical protein
MKVLRVLRPGFPGIKKIEQQFGSKLICVRYRYDESEDMTLKTVELIVDKFPKKVKDKVPVPGKKHFIRIGYNEKDLREKIKKAGGWWNAEKKLWELAYGDIVKLNLGERIIQE